MTYSINVKASTKIECKRRVTAALTAQTMAQPGHMHDRPHVERLLCALIDLQKENAYDDIVCDAYGYVSVAGDGSIRMACVNVKVYTTPNTPAIVELPPPGTF